MASNGPVTAGEAPAARGAPVEEGVRATRFLDLRAFLADFHASTAFGATSGGGLDRQAGTPDHGRVRDWFQGLAERAGFTVRTDRIGNIFALLELVPGAPFVLVGSHTDSQPRGGRFDGPYGVVAALHAADAVRRAVDRGQLHPSFNLAVVDWFNEEGSRFGPSIMGSSVFTGAIDIDTALTTTDPDGVSVADALEATGRLGEALDLDVAAYGEIHIEQGRRLEESGIDVGVVRGNWTAQKLRARVVGEQSHAGTLLAYRKDALLPAAKIVCLVNDLAKDYPASDFLSSVAQFDVSPNSPSVIASQVDLILDLRGRHHCHVASARAEITRRLTELSAEHAADIEIDEFVVRPRNEFSAAGVRLAQEAAESEGLSVLLMDTLIGHDSVAMNQCYPTVMLFLPSKDGASHCEWEFTSDDDMLKGLRALTAVLSRLVQHDLR
ncbi:MULTISPECIES: M20 family metallo-hydrolase [unclassified Dietzia]|uniref:M20 family metallo-hydrolase n=1 Tax=unclassified Dietzia TaxID=2617939 RepID=UPI0015FDE580|nr:MULTISPECIES: M20 family metallo-hydrolase [unclassified Dietzia]MBB1024147.1 M20 family metallo-hydrolase [Dietzia sp. DQ12-76]MBB1026179.1 M20 family metallo-hydrolase [Dietzia sp. DQ11-38-2]